MDRFDGEFDEVVAAARAGAPWALERIFTALSPVVAGYLRLQGAHEPEDLTSEVFLAVLRRIGSFRGDEAGFRSWVFTIAHRRLVDERRRLARRPAVAPLTDGVDVPAPVDVTEDALRSLSDQRVRELCERLLPDQRDVLLLRLLGHLTVEEVAAAIGRSPGAVKALQRRGFRAIARILEREGAPLPAPRTITTRS
ncbi:MAG TPA: RNA polymerase sigma factor [Acidimicrobiales bacterium]